MLMGGEEEIEDDVTLAGGAQPFAGGKLVEGEFLFQNHPPPPFIEVEFQDTGNRAACQADSTRRAHMNEFGEGVTGSGPGKETASPEG
jgi:hypothetical protein